MSQEQTTRLVPNTDLTAGDRIRAADGWVPVVSDAKVSSTNPGIVRVEIATGTLHMAAGHSSLVAAPLE